MLTTSIIIIPDPVAGSITGKIDTPYFGDGFVEKYIIDISVHNWRICTLKTQNFD